MALRRHAGVKAAVAKGDAAEDARTCITSKTSLTSRSCEVRHEEGRSDEEQQEGHRLVERARAESSAKTGGAAPFIRAMTSAELALQQPV